MCQSLSQIHLAASNLFECPSCGGRELHILFEDGEETPLPDYLPKNFDCFVCSMCKWIPFYRHTKREPKTYKELFTWLLIHYKETIEEKEMIKNIRKDNYNVPH